MTRKPSPSEGNWFTRALTQPRDELDRWERALRFPYDLGRYGARQLRQDRAPQMAGALAFRTLFALLPVLVVGTMLLRAIGGFEWFRFRLGEFFSALKLDEFQVVPPEANEASVTLSDWLLDLISQVQNINLAAITWVGVVVLFYSAMGLMVTIENSFNNIYRAPEGRAWLRRLPIYWTVLTVAPAAIAMTMYLSSRFDALVAEQGGWLSVFRAAPVIWSVTATWIVTFALYKLIPNTNVSYRPALVGALVASILLEVGKRTLGAYFQNAMSFSLLYGSLGLIPVFMFWVYLMWLVILFGLEVSATLQMLGGRRLEEIEAS
ncbi:MAG: YihY family inner membrane protein, partial [Planctomycetes bacterium]|nr:YihY family inner membrane protein [Planctomycetota bacterium]